MIEDIPEGDTGYLDFGLSDANGPYVGTGTTIEAVVTDRAGGAVDMTGKVAWLVAASGSVRVSPAAGDLRADRSPYTAKFIVTASGRTYTFPKKAADAWKVWK